MENKEQTIVSKPIVNKVFLLANEINGEKTDSRIAMDVFLALQYKNKTIIRSIPNEKSDPRLIELMKIFLEISPIEINWLR